MIIIMYPWTAFNTFVKGVNMKKIIIINGTGGSGKDTFVNYCSEYIKTVNISSVDKVKEAANILVRVEWRKR